MLGFPQHTARASEKIVRFVFGGSQAVYDRKSPLNTGSGSMTNRHAHSPWEGAAVQTPSRKGLPKLESELLCPYDPYTLKAP